MKQGDIVCWQYYNYFSPLDETSKWFSTTPFNELKEKNKCVIGVNELRLIAYWRIKQLKQPTTIQYTFDNPKGKIKLP